jgi:hypothetical protein
MTLYTIHGSLAMSSLMQSQATVNRNMTASF